MVALRRRGLRTNELHGQARIESELALGRYAVTRRSHAHPKFARACLVRGWPHLSSSLRMATGISVPTMTRLGETEIVCVTDEPLFNYHVVR